MARRARKHQDWVPPVRVVSPAKLRAAITRWKKAAPGRRKGQVARFLDVDTKTVGNWANGVTVPDGNQLLKLVAFLGVTLDDLSEPEE